MKILVTGSAGFIGFHVVKALVANQENFVVGIDNINEYYDIHLKYGRLSACGINEDEISPDKIVHSSEHSNYHFGQIDLTDFPRLLTLFCNYQFDYVINLAAQAGVRYSMKNPQAYVHSNLLGFTNLLECCSHTKIKHLIYASSSSVYGMNKKIPYEETDTVDTPVSFYAATKKSNELMAHAYSHLFSLPTTGVRLFTVYGSWSRPDMAPMLFANAILQNKPIKVFNNGDMLRDFTYVDDVAKSITMLLPKVPDKYADSPFYRILNIGNSQPVNLLDFIHTLEDEMQAKAQLQMMPFQSGDVKATYADVSKLVDCIGYRPDTPLREGIKSFVGWFNNHHEHTAYSIEEL